MKKNKTNSINITENLSRTDVLNFQNGNDINMNDVFEKDSLEGWAKNNTQLSIMKNLDKRFLNSKNVSLNYTIYIGIFIFIISSILIYSNSFQSKKKKIIEHSVRKETKHFIEKTDIQIPQEISMLGQIPKKRRIIAKTIKVDFSNKRNELEKISEIQNLNNEVVTIKTKELQKINTNEKIILEKRVLNAKEIYIQELLIVDYRKYRTKATIKIEQIVISGLPANFEKKIDKIEDLEWRQVDIPYIDYLSKTIELFSKGNYKKSLIRFEEILKAFPDDLNANFYGGLCYYNLGEFQKASDLFNNCLNNEFTNFKQEAYWYFTKTLISLKEYKKATVNLNQIITENEFYSEQAKICLKKLQKEN